MNLEASFASLDNVTKSIKDSYHELHIIFSRKWKGERRHILWGQHDTKTEQKQYTGRKPQSNGNRGKNHYQLEVKMYKRNHTSQWKGVGSRNARLV